MYQFLVICLVVLLKLCSSSEKNSAVNLAYSLYDPPNIKSDVPPSSPIVILHGLLGSKRNWNLLSKVIAEKTNRQVFALDARNHGDSPHSDEFSYIHMVADTVEFMDKLDIKQATLIGHSLGGKTSILISLLHPEMVESLIIVDISPRGVSPGFANISKIVKAMMDVELPSGLSLFQARKQLTEKLKKDIQDPGLIKFLLTNLVEKPQKTCKWRINLKSIYENCNHIGEYNCDIGKVYEGPTLFIGGGNSDYIREENHELIKEIFPAVEIKYIPGAGHWVHSEKPNEFLCVTCDFINNLKKKKSYEENVINKII